MAKRNENPSKKRKQNKLILFAAEGHNATETLYLKDLIKNLNGVVLRKAHGNETDPIGMIENLIASMDALGFDSDYGDLAFCFVNLDCDKGKEKQIRNAEQLEKRAIEKGYAPNTADYSPATDVYRIFQLITEIKKA